MAGTVYAVLADIQKLRTELELRQLTDFDSLGKVNTTIVDTAIEWASAQIDSYARTRYDLPLQKSNQVIGLCVTFTAYRLEADRNILRETTEKEYNRAIAFLKDVSRGVASFDQDQIVQGITSGGAAGPDKTAKPDSFGRGETEAF